MTSKDLKWSQIKQLKIKKINCNAGSTQDNFKINDENLDELLQDNNS